MATLVLLVSRLAAAQAPTEDGSSIEVTVLAEEYRKLNAASAVLRGYLSSLKLRIDDAFRAASAISDAVKNGRSPEEAYAPMRELRGLAVLHLHALPPTEEERLRGLVPFSKTWVVRRTEAVERDLSRLRDCFPSPGRKVSVSCANLTNQCSAYESDGWDLFEVEIEDDATIVRSPARLRVDEWAQEIQAFDALPGDVIEAEAQIRFSTCRLLALSGKQFRAAQFSRAPTMMRWWRAQFVYTLDDLLEVCGGSFNGFVRGRVRRLVAEYPTALQSKWWLEDLERGEAACRKLAGLECSHVRFVKGIAVYDYVTIGCFIRSVTVEDVERDVDKFRKHESTRADILDHSAIADRLRACEAAHRAGFSWLYVAPRVEKDCRPSP